MMEASLAVQRAVVAALAAAAVTSAGAAVPVFDRVPDAQSLPYIEVGDDQVVPDRADCFDQSCEVHSTVHVFSYGGIGRAGCKAIAQQVIVAVENAVMDLAPDWTQVLTQHEGSRYLDESDGKTVHAVLTFKTLLDAA